MIHCLFELSRGSLGIRVLPTDIKEITSHKRRDLMNDRSEHACTRGDCGFISRETEMETEMTYKAETGNRDTTRRQYVKNRARNRRSSTCACMTMHRFRGSQSYVAACSAAALNHFCDPTMRAELEMPNPSVPWTRYIRAYARINIRLHACVCAGIYAHSYTGWPLNDSRRDCRASHRADDSHSFWFKRDKFIRASAYSYVRYSLFLSSLLFSC